MTSNEQLPPGTPAWLTMVGTLMREAAAQAGLPPSLTVSFVERYTDGAALADGLVQGLRFDITGGQPSFRVGVRPDETADIVVEITAAAARQLNALYSHDPAYAAAQAELLRTGDMRVVGDPAQLGPWLAAVHDPIVARTRPEGA